jgi:glycosyltransferase involved in cell wall biosynthesis
VISFRRQYPAWLYPGSSDKDPSQSSVKVAAEYLLDPFYAWTWQQCARRILEKKTELVVLQWWTTYWTMPFAYLVRWCHRHHIPTVYLIHNVLPHEEKLWDKAMAKLALSPADGFIVQTPREQERLLTLLPGANSQISPHPAYNMLTNQRVDRAAARQKLGLPVEGTLLLFFGIVRPYKGLKYLIEALSLLRNEGRKPSLLVAGDFWEERSLYEKQIEAAGLSEQIRLDDRYIPDEDAAILFSAADALVAPYVGGTQSGVAGIGVGFGLPMIVTEQIASGLDENGLAFVLVVPPGDARALAQAIKELISHPHEKAATKSNGEVGWDRLVIAVASLYQEIIRAG